MDKYRCSKIKGLGFERRRGKFKFWWFVLIYSRILLNESVIVFASARARACVCGA